MNRSASVRALLTGLIDYAGLFPPAKLPLDQAWRQYIEYRQGPDAWMLGRFIVPAARLAEVSATAGDLLAQVPRWSYPGLWQPSSTDRQRMESRQNQHWSFAALGRGGSSIAEFMEGLQADLEAIQVFRQNHKGRVAVDVYEVKLPAELLAAPRTEQVSDFYRAVSERIAALTVGRLASYFEAAFPETWRTTLPAVLPTGYGGLKLRCGGLEAAAFPTVEQVAFAITSCRAANVPFKATAGLHHPLRHTDTALNVKMHGFLNVFGAALLAHRHGFTEEQVRAVLEDEQASHFVFDRQQFRWREVSINLKQIRAGRETVAVSFGSCSFDEPRNDLRALGLLP